MNPIFFYSAIILVLIITLALAVWKMFEFRRRHHTLISNPMWEKTLERNSLYKEHTIIFFGDSQIELWQMCPYFGSLPIRNRGKSGEQALEALERFERDVLDLQPGCVVFLTGANDLGNGRDVADVTGYIERMVSRAADLSIKTIVCSLLPFRRGVYEDAHLIKLIDLNHRIQKIVPAYNATYIDFFTKLSNEKGFLNPKYTDDGRHPNMEGYFVMTKLLREPLCKILFN